MRYQVAQGLSLMGFAAMVVTSTAFAAPERIVCKAFSAEECGQRCVTYTSGNQVIEINDSTQNVSILDGYVGLPVTVTEYDANVIAFFLTDPQGRKMYYRIDRVTGEFSFNYGHPMNGKCTRATQQF